MKKLSKEEIIDILESLASGEINVEQAYDLLYPEKDSKEDEASTNAEGPPTGGPKPGGGNP